MDSGHISKISWIVIFFAVLIWSAINPFDRLTWALEAAPAVIGFIILLLTHKVFPLTPLIYGLILFHCIILMVGSHYTYANVPLFNDMKEWFGWERNNYDKVGHFVQGFVPAMIAREILLRKQVIANPKWRVFFIVCFCLAFSAFYELIEWWVALLSGDDAVAFLGTQGYVWDTQSDMAWALTGAILALLILSSWHDRQLSDLSNKTR